MKFQKPKGTKDILPKDIHKWHFVEKTIREVMSNFGFSEIRTPTFEYTELFARGVGSETDIVGKEMYTFNDKGEESMTLRPEGTAPVIRAYIENSLSAESPVHKLYYITNMFRYERPQAGRFREHTQFGAELIGSDDYRCDVELISLAKEVYNRCGINNFTVKVNSIGKPDERKNYINILKEYLTKNITRLSEDSKKRLEKNPLRILDSKDKNDKQITESAPKILDNLGNESKARFQKVLSGLTQLGISYEVDFRLVRGLDYYTDTTFEFVSEDLGAQDAIGGGGRYDGLVELLGGKPTPSVGFGSGIERLILVADKNNFSFTEPPKLRIYFVALNEEAKSKSLLLANDLRKKGVACETDLLSRSMKAQMREANKLGADYVYIIGDEEMKSGKGVLKKMSDGAQTDVEFESLKDHVKLHFKFEMKQK
jgi:histidyl-tRNA synthetase